MVKSAPKLQNLPDRWETRQRLLFIESRLYWTGRINRKDIIKYFGISMPQSSADLTLYQELAPENAIYDKSGKTYRACEDFRPIFVDPALDQFLGHHLLRDDFLGAGADVVTMPSPTRAVEPATMRRLLIAIREKQALQVHYQSMSRPNPAWRWISPHAFGHDGYRWHVRAWCYARKRFTDFVLGRIDEVGDTRPQDTSVEHDFAWNKWVEIRFAPHPALPEGQQQVIERDYGMCAGVGTLKVQEAMLFYVLVHLRLESDDHQPPNVHIKLVNPEIRKLVQP